MRHCLDDLLQEEMDNRTSRFVWLRQFEVGKNSADINRQLDRLEFLQRIALSSTVLSDIPAHRIARLRRQGERYFTDGLRDITSDRRLAILAVCVVERAAAVADTVVETHDRIVGAIWRDAKKICDTHIAEAQVEIEATLAGFETLGATLLMAKGDEEALAGAVDASCGWGALESLVAKSRQLRATVKADVLAHVPKGFHRFKRYARRMLSALDITCADVAQPLLKAAEVIREKRDIPTGSLAFLLPRSKWRGHFQGPETDRERLWVVAVLFHLRDTFRSGDIWLTHSRRYADMKQALVPIETARAMGLVMPLDPESWIEDRKRRLEDGLKRLAAAARTGTLPGGVIEDGTLRVERLDADVPEEASDLVLDLYRRLPEARITDILMEVHDATGFTEAFTHLHTGAPCWDKVGLLNVVLAEGLNLSLSKMVGATSTHDFMQLSRLSRWHVEGEGMDRALAMVIEAQARLLMAQYWGAGQTASSDGQLFPTTRQGEAMNLINAKYGQVPGLKAYTHVSDQYAPFASQVIPATVGEAPYILDGLLMNDAGRKIKEQYADTGGFTDLVFAATSLLGYMFIPRIRDLASKRLHVFDPQAVPKELKGLTGGRIRETTIIANWPDVLRSIATMLSGRMQPSHLLKKLAARPRQHDLALALREIGRVERTLFIIEWLLNTEMQHRAQIGLNKGEAHHALKGALRIGRQGEIRDRTTEGQHFRIAGLNLLTAIIIYWNTKQIGIAVAQRQKAGLDCSPDLLAHISPLGWAHILLTGEYRWQNAQP
jgi:TnpA family transposase